MRVKVYVVDFGLSPRGTRWALRVGAAVAVLGAAAVAMAAMPLHTWSNGDLLKAADLNANFAALSVVSDGGARYSVGPTSFCGATATMQTGKLGGYAAGGLCQARCGGSPAAHVCTSEELIRSTSIGVVVPSGYYATGAVSSFDDCTLSSTTNPKTGVTSYSVACTHAPIDDCSGFTSDAGGDYGTVWTASGAPGMVTCSTEADVLCCD